MKLEKGDIIKISLSENTVVLDVGKDRATLFSGKEFTVVRGIDFDKKADKFIWQGARYANDLNSINLVKTNDFENMKK